MTRNLKPILLTILILSSFSGLLADGLFHPSHQLWQPAKDDVYLQEVSHKIKSDKPIESVALFNDKIFTVIDSKIHTVLNDEFVPMDISPQNVSRLEVMGNKLWALTDKGLFRLDKSWKSLIDEPVVDMCMHNGLVHAATRNDIYKLENNEFVDIEPKDGYLSSDITVVMEDGSQVLSHPVHLGPIHRIQSYSGTLYILRPGKLVLFDGRIVNDTAFDWGMLPSSNTNDLMAMGSRLFISTDRGLAVLRGASMTTLQGTDGLPSENTTCLAQGFDQDLWIGTTTGAVRMLKDDWHYFGPQLWLPGNNVHDIAVGANKVVIATDKGLGIISYEPYTLAKKADYYEKLIDNYGHRRMGFLHLLYWGGDNKGWVREISDNDGGHTAPYLAAMCYKYAVTGDETARKNAVDAFKAMVWLDQITPKKGFIARAIWSPTGDKDNMATEGSGGLPAKWYPTDDGKWYWKGDTSSDEVDAHIYSVSLFHDLVAKGEEKELAAQHLSNIATHILENGWVLRDMDGKPTRWGRWDPDYLLRPYGYVARGLNGMQAQTYMKTAFAVSGDKKYQKGFDQLMKWGYQNYTVRQKITYPPEDIAPWDDNLANRCYYTLFRYVDDPNLLSIYLRSLERTYELKRLEHIPWYNFTYGAITGNDCEVDESVKHLREWVLDCHTYRYTNSHRDDLQPEEGYVPLAGGTRAISPREASVKGGSRNALNYDGGGGYRIKEPTGFLRDYWMGRYHGFITAPTVTDKNLTTAPEPKEKNQGAEPYSGPARPEIKLLK